jgi:hypothetical protein
MVSKLADATREFLKKIFPHNLIFEEYYINYKDTRLFFDFYIKEIDVLIEVQGRQHNNFVKHFHDNKEGFLDSKRRYNLKKAYCQKTDTVLIEIRSEKELERSKFIERILERIEL